MQILITQVTKQNHTQCNICDKFLRVSSYYLPIKNINICYGCIGEIFKNLYDADDLENLAWEIREKENLNKPKRYKKMIIPNELKLEVWRRDGLFCLKCGSIKKLSTDHIIPEIKGGKTEINNLQTLCKPCNSQKGTKTIDYRKTIMVASTAVQHDQPHKSRL